MTKYYIKMLDGSIYSGDSLNEAAEQYILTNAKVVNPLGVELSIMSNMDVGAAEVTFFKENVIWKYSLEQQGS